MFQPLSQCCRGRSRQSAARNIEIAFVRCTIRRVRVHRNAVFESKKRVGFYRLQHSFPIFIIFLFITRKHIFTDVKHKILFISMFSHLPLCALARILQNTFTSRLCVLYTSSLDLRFVRISRVFRVEPRATVLDEYAFFFFTSGTVNSCVLYEWRANFFHSH